MKGHLLIAAGLLAMFSSVLVPVPAFARQTLSVEQEGSIVLAPNSCLTVSAASAFPEAVSGYRRKYNTIAHKFLDDEIGAGDVTPDMYLILDSLIDEARTSLKSYRKPTSTALEIEYAKSVLRGIDCILLRHRFVYPGHGFVQLLSDGLDPTTYSGAGFDELMGQRHNTRRAKFITAPGAYYVVDCDIASYVYLAIAEVLRFPIHLVEIPRHNFVRWDIGPGQYVDYETMDGYAITDDYYIHGWAIPAAFTGRGGVLKSMSPGEDIAYHYRTVAAAWSWRGNTEKMIEFDLKSLAGDSTRAGAPNNLAWYYATAPNLADRDGAKAIAYAKQAVALVPDGDDLDTLACAYAQAGQFDQGLSAETAASASGYVPFGSNITLDTQRISNKQTCEDPGFGHDPSPFRPIVATTNSPADQAALRPQ